LSELVRHIIAKNYADAERLFNERIEVIAENKMREKKKMIMAKESVEFLDNDKAIIQKMLARFGGGEKL